MDPVPYPSRPRLEPLPEFRGSARPGVYAAPRLKEFVVDQYVNRGRSLREIAELTDHSFSAVRNLLDRLGHLRREVGAPAVSSPVED